MSYIVVEEISGKVPYNKVYTGKGHAKRALESNRAAHPGDNLAIIHLDPTLIKRLLLEQNNELRSANIE